MTAPTTTPPTAPPTVEALAVKHLEATRLVEIRCPLCGRRHVHGWPYGRQTIGHRISHCLRDRGGYTIQPPAHYKEAAA